MAELVEREKNPKYSCVSGMGNTSVCLLFLDPRGASSGSGRWALCCSATFWVWIVLALALLACFSLHLRRLL